MTISAKIIAHSACTEVPNVPNLVTFQLVYPRYIHAQVMTHRVFSRNASSSRAIPTEKVIHQIQTNPATPAVWGANEPGMSASKDLSVLKQRRADQIWYKAMDQMISAATTLKQLDVHKQILNRILEPWSHITVLVTATEWANFFKLRLDDAAQPEIQVLATHMHRAITDSVPRYLKPGEWHAPFAIDRNLFSSVAGCARVSYNNHDSTARTLEKDVKLYRQLAEAGHLSPFEHQATPMADSFVARGTRFDWEPGITHQDREGFAWSGNFRGWIQNRQLMV